MQFQMEHPYFPGDPEVFSEHTAPDWLTSKNTIEGSTMDARWFWRDHVLTLEVGESIYTDFHKITRIQDENQDKRTGRPCARLGGGEV